MILWFQEVGLADVSRVGGKNASLGEMFSAFSKKSIRVPNGFAITTDAYWLFIEHNGLKTKIENVLSDLDTTNIAQLQRVGSKIRALISGGQFPTKLVDTIIQAYRELGSGSQSTLHVAVRSSATAEDLPQASFAGQQETYLNVFGEKNLLQACKKCFESLFTDRAISYRTEMGFDHMQVGLSIGVQKMVRSDLAASGVMFTIDTETGFRDVVLINASYGLGEAIVKGSVIPDEYQVFKPTLAKHRPIIQKILGQKDHKIVYGTKRQQSIRNAKVLKKDQLRFAIDDDDILTLAKWGCTIEAHYSRLSDRHTPLDIEWAKDGITGDLYVLQARPETIHRHIICATAEIYHLHEKGRLLVSGRSVGQKIASGPVRIIENVKQLDQLKMGEILVTDKTDPDWEPAMKRASAIVTNSGGRTCHAAIVSRELGLAAIVGTKKGTTTLRPGKIVTVCCAEGDTGNVYEGDVKFTIDRIDLKDITKPKTDIMMIIGNPDHAFRHSFIPNCGVGLARIEFIVSHSVRIHPMALVEFQKVKDRKVRAQIESLTAGYPKKPLYFIDKLAQGVAQIAAAFYPNDVIVRMSDFKTNEYRNLIGGTYFEPIEENPMIGFRGASRYYDDRYRKGFALECIAMKKVREEMGLRNVKLMIPFCRTVDEGKRVLKEMDKHGLRRGHNNLEVYVMCEIPSNVILAKEFAEIFDGFSIGSNDLTQLTLGIDRDSNLLSHLFDERNEAVKTMIKMVIAAAKAKKRKIGICGQAPSDHPQYAEFLIEEGIDSISLNPDAVFEATLRIAEAEKKFNR